jgi:hypothetical protein
LFCSKGGLLKLKKNQIKYGYEGFEIRNNFPYWNISILRIEFDLMFGGLLRIEFNWNLVKKYLGVSEFDEICPISFSLHLVAK